LQLICRSSGWGMARSCALIVMHTTFLPRGCRGAECASLNLTSSPDLSNDFACMPTRSLNTVPNENLFKEMLHSQKSPKYRTGLLFSTSTTPRPSKSIPAILSMHQASPRNRGPAARAHKLRKVPILRVGEDHPRKGNYLERVDLSRSPPHLRKDDRLRDTEEREKISPPLRGVSTNYS